MLNDWSDYLTGSKFSNAHSFALPIRDPMQSRDALITSLSEGRKVLHVGCSDHVPLIGAKRSAGTYLHDRLVEVSEEVVGFDTNVRALEEMRALGMSDLYSNPQDIRGMKFNLVLIPDVIEHVPNVGEFLESFKSFEADMLITTPNAYRLANRLQLHAEVINTDHRYWFSPYTLAKTAVEAGFEVADAWYTDTSPRSLKGRVYTALVRRHPLLRSGLAMLIRTNRL